MLVHALGMWLCSLNLGHLMSVKVFFNQHLQPPFKPPSTNKVKSVFLIVFEHKGKREYMY